MTRTHDTPDAPSDARHVPEPDHEALHDSARWWRETLLRVAFLLALAVGVEALFHGGPLRALGAHPHPYWLVVLPLAASRGLVGGLAAAGASSALVLAAAVLARGAELGPVRALASGLAEPLLFVAAAALVGELADRLRGDVREAVEARRALAADVARIRYEREVLEATSRELERRLAYGPGGIGGVLGAARRMQGDDVDGLYAATLELVLEHVGDAASIVEVDGRGELTLALARGGGADRDLALVAHSPLVQLVRQRGESADAHALGGDALPAGPCMVAPLLDHTRAVRALLLLDGLAPERLGPGTFRTFVALADWASSGLARIALGAAPLAPPARAETIATSAVPRTLGAPECLAAALGRELARAERHALNVAVVGVQFALDGRHDAAVATRLDALALDVLARGLRASDGLFAFGFPGCYAVVLPGTDVRGAALVQARLEAQSAAVERRLGVGARATVVGPEYGEVTVELAFEALAQRFRAGARRPLGIPEREPADPRRAGDLAALAARLAAEACIARRFGLPYQLLDVRAARPICVMGSGASSAAHGAKARGAAALEPLAAAARQALRRGAEVFALGPEHALFLVPGLPSSAAHLVVARLEAALHAAGVEARVGRAFDSESGADVDLLVRTLAGGVAA